MHPTCRSSIEGNIDFKLPNLLTRAVELLPKNMNLVTIAKDVEIFIYERLRGYLSDSGFQIDTIDAVRSVRPESLFDFHRRVQAVHEFRKLPEAESLAAANKRIRNILKKADNEMLANVNSDLLSEGSERNLYNSLVEMEKTVAPNIQIHEYGEALASLAKLKLPIDSFFDDVMVMDDRDEIRSNRIALVTRISNQFTAIADISCLQN